MSLTLEQIRTKLYEIAALSPCAKRKVGCIVACHDGPYTENGIPTSFQILAEGFNYNPVSASCEIGVNEVTKKLITHPEVLHAEEVALSNYKLIKEEIPWSYSDNEIILFVTYQPCDDCLAKIREADIKQYIVLDKENNMSTTEQKLNKTDHNAMLAERGSRYGKFTEHAKIATNLKEFMHQTPGWQRLSPDQREALDMIQHKVARILNGDPMYKDNWDDIVGYAKLCSDELV